MKNQLRPAIILTIVMAVLTGLTYPFVVTRIANLLFPHASHGSLTERSGKVIGSDIIGQNFSRPGYFAPRPSAAGGAGYDGMASGGSNLGPTSKTLVGRVDSLAKAMQAENPSTPVPVDMVTASGSGLDPDITPAAAEFQTPRVARERGISVEDLRRIVQLNTEPRQFGILGEPRVNVLRLNLALDDAKRK